MREKTRKTAARLALAIGLALSFAPIGRAEEPISFVLPAANFQPVAADAYGANVTPPAEPTPAEPLTPPANPPLEPTRAQLMTPDGSDSDIYDPSTEYEPLACPNCDGGCNGGCLPPGRLPNGQYPDDWMWGCGQWPYANGPGTCDDWKVGPIWDVTVDGMVMTRESVNLQALEARMAELHTTPALPTDPDFANQFDHGPGGRVYLTGLVPRDVGYQVMAGYEGINDWNAAIVYPEQPTPFPPFGQPTTQRTLSYESTLNSGEINILRMCNPALRPYCGFRYIRFDDEIWDQSNQELVPPIPIVNVSEIDTLDIFDIENNLMGFQGGAKYDVWNWGRRFSLQGFVNGGVYYNASKWSHQEDEFHVNYSTMGTPVTASSNSSLVTVHDSNIAYVGEASLTAVCRINKCWAGRVGYQVLFIDGVHLASDAYLDSTVEERSMIFHGWHVGLECRR